MQKDNGETNTNPKKSFSTKQTNTPPEFMECKKCKERETKSVTGNVIGDCCSSDVIDDYVKAINYINSCHSIINEITKNSNATSLNVNMPDVPNFLAIFRTLNGVQGDNQREIVGARGKTENITPPTHDVEDYSTIYSDPKNNVEISINLQNEESDEDTEEIQEDAKPPMVQEKENCSQKSFIELIPDIKNSKEYKDMEYSLSQATFPQDMFTTDSSENEFEVLQRASYHAYTKQQQSASSTEKVVSIHGAKEFVNFISCTSNFENINEKHDNQISRNSSQAPSVCSEAPGCSNKKETVKGKSKIPALSKIAMPKSLSNFQQSSLEDVKRIEDDNFGIYGRNVQTNFRQTLSQQDLDKYAKELLQATDNSEDSSPRSFSSDEKGDLKKPSPRQTGRVKKITKPSKAGSPPPSAKVSPKPPSPINRSPTPTISMKSTEMSASRRKISHDLINSHLKPAKCVTSANDHVICLNNCYDFNDCNVRSNMSSRDSYHSFSDQVDPDNGLNRGSRIKKITNHKRTKQFSPSVVQGMKPKVIPPPNILTNRLDLTNLNQDATGSCKNNSKRRLASPAKIQRNNFDCYSNAAMENNKTVVVANPQLAHQINLKKYKTKDNKCFETNKMNESHSSGGSIILSDSDPICTDSDIDEDHFQSSPRRLNHQNQHSSNNPNQISTEMLGTSVNSISRTEMNFSNTISPDMEQKIIAATSSKVDLNKKMFRRPRQEISASSEDDDDKILKFTEDGQPRLCSSKCSRYTMEYK